MKRKAVCTDPKWAGRADCVHCAIRQRVLFADLPASELNDALIVIDDLVYGAGGVIYQSGESEAVLYTVRRGLIKLVRSLPDGEQRVVRLLKTGDIAGIEAIVGAAYKHTAVAIGEVEVCRIPISVIERLEMNHPLLVHQLMVRWQNALDEADRALVEFSTGSAEERVARLLLHLSALARDGSCPNLSRQDIGSLLGIATETASRAMAELRRRGGFQESAGGDLCNFDRILLARIGESP